MTSPSQLECNHSAALGILVCTTPEFSVNPVGVRGDFIAFNDNSWGDDSWGPVWKAAASVDSVGWTAELRIPFSQPRFPNVSEQAWGINFSRMIYRNDELVRWSWAPDTEESERSDGVCKNRAGST